MADTARDHLIKKLAELLGNVPRKETLACKDAIEEGRACRRMCFLMTDEGWDSDERRPAAEAKLTEQLAGLQERRRVKAYEVRRDPHFGLLMLVILVRLI